MAIAKSAQLRAGRVLEQVCKLLAYGGGALLVAMALVTVFSVIGRALIAWGLGPIRGDFELVEAGCAIAIFAFLPWCQLKRGHVTVDVLVDRMGGRIKAFLGMMGDVAICLISGLILWRIYLGLAEKFPYGGPEFREAFGMGSKPFFPETTYELAMPVWIPFALATVGACIFFVVSLYTVWRSLNWLLDNEEARV